MVEDFAVNTSTRLTFTSGITSNGDSECVEISIIDDDIYEDDQQFTVSIATVSPPSIAEIGFPSSMILTIQDNNGLWYHKVCIKHILLCSLCISRC